MASSSELKDNLPSIKLPTNNAATTSPMSSTKSRGQNLHRLTSLIEYIFNEQNTILEKASNLDSFPEFDWFIDPQLYTMTSTLRQFINSDRWQEVPFGITKEGIENDKFMQKWLEFDLSSKKAHPLMTGIYKVYILDPEERIKAHDFFSRQITSIAKLWDTILEKNSQHLLESEREAFGHTNYAPVSAVRIAGRASGGRTRQTIPASLARSQSIAMHQAAISMHDSAISMHRGAAESHRAALATYQGTASRERAMPSMGPTEPNTDTNDKQHVPARPAGYTASGPATGATRKPMQTGQQGSGSSALLSFKNHGQPSVGGIRLYSSDRGSFTVPTHTTEQPQPPNWNDQSLCPSASSSQARGVSVGSRPIPGGPTSSRSGSYQPVMESPLRRVLDFNAETQSHLSQTLGPASGFSSPAMPKARETKRQRTDSVSTHLKGKGVDTSSFYGC